jgi:hypothetical protein
MKITKNRLNQIIKEEVATFTRENIQIAEASGYTMDIFASMRKKYGDQTLLEKMVEYFSDSEIMDCFRYISKQAGEKNVPLEPQSALGGGATPAELGGKENARVGAAPGPSPDLASKPVTSPITRVGIPSKMANKAVTDKDLADREKEKKGKEGK